MDLDFELNQTSFKQQFLMRMVALEWRKKIKKTKEQEEETQTTKARCLMEAKGVRQGCRAEPGFYLWHENIHSLDYLPVFCFYISNDKIQFLL